METSLAQTDNSRMLALVARANELLADSVAPNTRLAYSKDFAAFAAWCEDNGFQSMPADPATVAFYLGHLLDTPKANGQPRKASTIDRVRAAIRMAHETSHAQDPTENRDVKNVLKSIRRKLGTAPTRKAPVLCADVQAMISALPDNLKGKRDRALLLVGFAGAFRRSELAGIEVSHLDFTTEGVKIHLAFSKTDQEGAGRDVAILRGNGNCPVRALEEWLTAAGITSGPVFRNIDKGGTLGQSITPQSIALVVKERAKKAGLDPAKYSGHSLRAGFVTQSSKNGATISNIMRQTGHTSVNTVQGYIRIANIFEDNASGKLGL